jgi:hypothetical protein
VRNRPAIRGACRFRVLLDMKNKDLFDKVQDAYGDGCVSYVSVRKWAKTYRESRSSLVNDPRSGRLQIPHGIERILAMVESGSYQSGSAIA